MTCIIKTLAWHGQLFLSIADEQPQALLAYMAIQTNLSEKVGNLRQ